MKKLITLLLVLTGMVTTASAKTIYLANNWDKSNVWVGIGNSTSDNDLTWTQLSQYESYGDCKTEGGSNYSHSIYKIDLGNNTNFHITYSGEDFPCLNSSDFEDGGYYKFNWNGSSRELIPITIYSYNFTVNTASTYSSLKIYPFYNGTQTSWGWNDSPDMSKDENEYTYSIKTIYSSINVIFYNADAQTGTMVAEFGSNSYYIDGMVLGSDNGESVKTNGSGYATFVNSAALTMTSGIAYVAEDLNNGSAVAHTITSAPASTPMLIHGEANTTYHFAKGGSEGDLPCTNAFKAGDGSAVASGTGPYNYILNGNLFKAANGQTVRSGKAYLQITSQVPAGARVLYFDDEDVTGISQIENGKLKVENYFNLAGQRVTQPTKGLYIVNGKKVLVK